MIGEIFHAHALSFEWFEFKKHSMSWVCVEDEYAEWTDLPKLPSSDKINIFLVRYPVSLRNYKQLLVELEANECLIAINECACVFCLNNERFCDKLLRHAAPSGSWYQGRGTAAWEQKMWGDLKRPFPRLRQDDIASYYVITAHSTKTCMQKEELQMRSCSELMHIK